MGVAIPSFWMGLLLSVIFAVKTDLLPAIGYVGLTEDPVEWLRHLVLPAFSLGLASSATLTRQLRGSVITAMQQDYIRTARAKGLRQRSVVFKHLLKNASMPAVTALGLQIPVLLSGTVIIEGLFGLNGIGQFAVSAVMRRDLHVVQAVVLLSAVVVVFVNIAVDVSYAFLNPKTRLR
jgi:peptide/nickel transport system permease protein